MDTEFACAWQDCEVLVRTLEGMIRVNQDFLGTQPMPWLEQANAFYGEQLRLLALYSRSAEGMARYAGGWRQEERERLRVLMKLLESFIRYNANFFEVFYFHPQDADADNIMYCFYNDMYYGMWREIRERIGEQGRVLHAAATNAFGRVLDAVHVQAAKHSPLVPGTLDYVRRAVERLRGAQVQPGKPYLTMQKQWWVVMRVLKAKVKKLENMDYDSFCTTMRQMRFDRGEVPCVRDSVKKADNANSGYDSRFRQTAPEKWRTLPRLHPKELDDVALAERLMELLEEEEKK